ncbi:MAG: efflux RND transporter permease subunit [Alphaproteobacteria bacterium]|nr:efflux RND transporter permease subunit [Alphaproteobacteria bacterium]
MTGDGLIGLFARHRTAANLLMVLMIVVGLFALYRLTTQFFPEFGIDIIRVSVVWPGASAEDVDSNIVQAIEPEVRFIDGVDKVSSTSTEGAANIVIEFVTGTDMQAALSDVEAAVGQVRTLPEESERPIISRIVRYETIMRLVISGPYSERALKSFAKRIRDDLLERGIDRVTISGGRDEEITVEVTPATLRRFDLTLGDVARRIDETSIDLPLGVAGGGAERQLRSLGLVKDARGIGEIEIKSLPNGQKVYLRDIARVQENFDDDDHELRRRGDVAIDLNVQRALSNDALELAEHANTYLDEVVPSFPPNLRIEKHDIAVELIESRINLLLRNGVGGLILVLLILFIFLNGPVAFWVAVGIPVSIMAALAFMLATGQSINMVSLFGLIMVIGIVVDDAIVVGEHIESRYRHGMPPLEAAITGARRMAGPVTSASLTTIAAFIPLLVISDIIGQIIAAIPMVVIAVVLASLVECFLVLPGHLHHSLVRHREFLPRFRRAFDLAFERFRDGTFRRWISIALAWRYSTLACAVGALIVAIGIVGGGRVGFIFFPSPEADRIYANFELSVGAPRDRTLAMLAELEDSLARAEDKLTGGDGGLVHINLSAIGTTMGRASLSGGGSGDNIGGMTVELVPSDLRDIRTSAVIDAWREEIRPIAGVTEMSILAAQAGPPGRWIHVDISGQDTAALKTASDDLKRLLDAYPGVSDVDDNLPYGKPEIILEVTPKGKAMGFTTSSVGRQVRNTFEGAIATRFPRGDEEVLVRVQFADEDTGPGALDILYLRNPSGIEVPLSEIVTLREKRGFAQVYRENGSRRVAVTGELDTERGDLNEIKSQLEQGPLADLASRYGVEFSFGGKAEEQAQTFGDMRIGASVALVLIYIILAWMFASYSRPLVVMSIIPFGFVGALIGHLLLGFDLTILSMIALVGLSGIVVNDSIILVSTIDERLASGEDAFQAIVDGTCDRLRAVILTSATTIGGLTPLLFETSLQAQFLIPMAVTLVFGLLGTTLLVLFVVPALIGIQSDFGRWLRPRRGHRPAPLHAGE